MTDGSQNAWFVCGKPRYRNAAPATVVARSGNCKIVLAPTLDDVETKHGVPLALGRAEHLAKTDPAVLVKALARYDVLHVVIDRNQSAITAADDGDSLAEAMGCRCRGMPNDFDCRPHAIARLLADERIGSIELWNRFWVRWK